MLELCLKISAGIRAIPACSLAFATQGKKKKSLFVSKEGPDEQETEMISWRGEGEGSSCSSDGFGEVQFPILAIAAAVAGDCRLSCSSSQKAGGETKAGRDTLKGRGGNCRGERPWLCNPASPLGPSGRKSFLEE